MRQWKASEREKKTREDAQRAKAETRASAQARAKLDAAVKSIPAQGSRLVTLQAYSELRLGISYVDACRIIGFWGQELSRNEIRDYTTVMYAWQNPDGSNMNAIFQNSELMSKSQFGLP